MLLLPLPGNEAMAASLAAARRDTLGAVRLHQFPDGETLPRLDGDVRGQDVAVIGTMRDPNATLLELLLVAGTARDLGARRVGLIAPYLAYMRQDVRFHPGEGVTSRYVAALVSRAFEWLVTVDPHLHRHRALSDLYSIPSRVARAAPVVAWYIKAHYPDGVVIGPDSESKQWVAEVAREAGLRHAVLRKERLGDNQVHVSLPDAAAIAGRRPIVVDDIVSSGATMVAVAERLVAGGALAPIAVGIHALFGEQAGAALKAAGYADVVTCNTVPHSTNRIDVSGAIVEALGQFPGLL